MREARGREAGAEASRPKPANVQHTSHTLDLRAPEAIRPAGRSWSVRDDGERVGELAHGRPGAVRERTE